MSDTRLKNRDKKTKTTFVELKNVTVEIAAGAGMLPTPRQEIIDAFVNYLIDQERMCRPPTQAAKLLAFIVQLHKSKPPQPFPPRKQVAAHLEMGVPTIDAAVSSRIAQGYLKKELDWVEGNVANRSSSVQIRYYVPSKDLVELYDAVYGDIARTERAMLLKGGEESE